VNHGVVCFHFICCALASRCSRKPVHAIAAFVRGHTLPMFDAMIYVAASPLVTLLREQWQTAPRSGINDVIPDGVTN
jgi:hypothetical protein